ncbi:MAG: transposase [Fibrobacter sp.]|nr:transposase [Fibrobacter sp.]
MIYALRFGGCFPACWKYDGLTNAGMEGFNNKVRTLIRLAYGYRDEEYMVLKIYDLPNKRVNDGL